MRVLIFVSSLQTPHQIPLRKSVLADGGSHQYEVARSATHFSAHRVLDGHLMNLTQDKPHLLPLRATGNDLGAGQGVRYKHMLIVLLQTYKPSVWECSVILMLFPAQTATHVNTSYVQVSGGLFSQLNMGAGVDARKSLNTTAHQNVYFRAILTSLTKSINGNLNIPHILRMFTEGNRSKLAHAHT